MLQKTLLLTALLAPVSAFSAVCPKTHFQQDHLCLMRTNSKSLQRVFHIYRAEYTDIAKLKSSEQDKGDYADRLREAWGVIIEAALSEFKTHGVKVNRVDENQALLEVVEEIRNDDSDLQSKKALELAKELGTRISERLEQQR